MLPQSVLEGIRAAIDGVGCDERRCVTNWKVVRHGESGDEDGVGGVHVPAAVVVVGYKVRGSKKDE